MSDEESILIKRAKQKLATALRQKVEAVKANGISFYKPHRKQDLFHRAGNYKYRYIRSGNRFGKSDCGAAEDIAFALGERPWYDKSDPARYLGIPKHPTKGLIICEDFDKSTEIFTNTKGDRLGKLFKLLPNGCYDSKSLHRNHSGAIDQIIVKRPTDLGGGASAIHIDTVKSFKQNKMSQESSDWDWLHGDEPFPKAMFDGIARGLMDRGGKFWCLCTPLSEMWINDFFVPSRATKIIDSDPLVSSAHRWMITGSTYDNPYVSPEEIKLYEENLTADDIQCRINGIPLALSGLVYKEFSDDRHIYRELPKGWVDFDQPPLDYTIRLAIDPHARTPHAVLFAATAPTGEVFFFHEMFDQCPISVLANRIKDRIERIPTKARGSNKSSGNKFLDRFVALAMVDPIAYNPNPIDNRTWADEFMANGLFLQKAPKDLTHGIQAVKQQLRITKNLFFSPLLKRTRWEFDHYIWDEQKDKPVDKDDHMMECLYRLVISGLGYIAPTSDDDLKQYEFNEDYSLNLGDL